MGWVGLSTNKSYIFLSQGIEKVKSRLGWVCVTFQSYYQGSTCGRAWTGTGLPELALNVNFAAFKDRDFDVNFSSRLPLMFVLLAKPALARCPAHCPVTLEGTASEPAASNSNQTINQNVYV